MLMAAHTSNSGLTGGAGDRFDGCFEDFDDGTDVYIDMDSFYQILKDDPPDPSQGNSLCQSKETDHEVGLSTAVGDCDKSMCQNDTSCCPPTNELNLPFSGEISSEAINETSEGFIKSPYTSSAEISLIDVNTVSASGNYSESGMSHVTEIGYVDMDSYAAMVQSWTEDHGTDGFMAQTLPTSVEMLNSENNEMDNLQPVFSYLDQIALPETKLQSMDQSISDVPIRGYHCQNADVQDFESGYYANLVGIDFFSGSSTSNIDTVPEQFMLQNQVIKDETGGEFPSTNALNYRLFEEVEYKDFSQKTSVAFADGHLVEDMLTMFPENQSLAVAKTEENEVVLSNRSHPSVDLNDKWMPLSLGPAVNSFPVYQVLDSHDPNSVKNAPTAEFGPVIVKSTSFRPEGCQVSSPNCGGGADDDLCILEDISHPGQMVPSLSLQSYTKTLNQLTPRTPEIGVSVGATRRKPHDERSIFRAALQDLSQPTLESNPPDGSLAVPLLRHQRIALHWMVQKETAGVPCSGGILADDQGLGKTISTIALILTEKPSSERIPIDMGKVELETLDVDEDDQLSKSDMLKKNSIDLMRGGNQMKSNDVFSLSKGRPAAGTLIVCPTSVMRQWAEELRTKVTSEANVSVLVYHGSHRTKDPDELARYDVVVTTYSIVSMEVPKQSFKEKDDGKRNLVPDTVHLSSSKKRKHATGSDRKRLKRGMGDLLPESTALPLARVRWFRVVLDEAQSIKNYKTRVAQACWGLRAKRRWCLSGTPIQNAVDDLYSYFRFLKYDPFDVYQLFCSDIKAPIGRSPARGYKKLQAILKRVMLRRTKGMLLDGEPIISLPPKSIELMRVEFSKEERAFYAKLEADSRAEFQNYAASGTVQQNYVNILLLLLRLRQACDHPHLVHRYDSSAGWESSLSEANKLSLEKLHSLLACLEASLAICGRCSDPPEDAVVSVCGHVFCNQCISEHLSGDNNHCPASNCRVQLSSSSVFSGAVLTCCLSGQTSEVTNSSPSVSHQSPNLRQIADPLGGRLLDSAKINTALEILQSLSKPQDCMAKTCSTEHNDSGPTSSDSSQSRGDITDSSDVKIPNSNAEANTSTVSVVNEKAIVFSQWTRMLDLLEAGLKKSTIQYRRLDGTMSVAARDKAVRDFNTLPEVTVMIMSLKAASLGLNMVAACHVLLLDPWWNPTTEDQAIDRAHRIGQTRPVTVYRLTVKDTVEDRILALQQKKREMVASAFGEDETGSRQTRLTVDDLNYLFMV